MSLHDIVTKGRATRAFTVDGKLNEAAIKQAWRHLAEIGSVQNLGPRFKRALRDPNGATGTASAPAAPRTRKRAAKAGSCRTRSSQKTTLTNGTAAAAP